MKKLRDYQEQISTKAADKLKNLKIVYLSMEVRTGKTLTALETVKKYGARELLFITKKKAIESILSDYREFNYDFGITVTNYENLHNIEAKKYDCLVCDENHKNSSFPQPNKCTVTIKKMYGHLPMIFLSGTPTPETEVQIFHQFWISHYSPLGTNFFRWAEINCEIKLKYLGYATVKDYSKLNEIGHQNFIKLKEDYFLTFSQKESGFESTVKENIVHLKMREITYVITKTLKRDNVFNGVNDLIVADTGVKLLSKLHQLYSGTCILESGDTVLLDSTKAEYIKQRFLNNKIAIFYKFKAELYMLKSIFGDDLCTELNEFNTTHKNIALQIISGREGISLSKADYLIYYNIDFSAVSYWQSRDRLTTIDRKSNEVFWIFSKDGIENKIYKSVMNKKNYTLNIFKKDCKLPLANRVQIIEKSKI